MIFKMEEASDQVWNFKLTLLVKWKFVEGRIKFVEGQIFSVSFLLPLCKIIGHIHIFIEI